MENQLTEQELADLAEFNKFWTTVMRFMNQEGTYRFEANGEIYETSYAAPERFRPTTPIMTPDQVMEMLKSRAAQ